jgi:ABC-2 type transport system permease protein
VNKLKVILMFMKLRLRAMLLYPTGLVLDIIREYVNVGIWLFVALFIRSVSVSVQQAFTNYVGYVFIGVIIFQNADKLVKQPFLSLSKAFWEKRLEVYNTSPFGIWGLVIGEFLFTFLFNGLIQVSIVLLLAKFVKLPFVSLKSVIIFFADYIVFIGSIFGLSLLSASTFFTLEVKQGREPVSWTVGTLVRLFSGVYYPITLFPIYLRWIGKIFPHYYMFNAARAMLGLSVPVNQLSMFVVLSIFAFFLIFIGIFAFRRAIVIAEKRSGMSVLV